MSRKMMMIATLQKLPDASTSSNKSTPAVVSDDDYEEDKENPPKQSKGEDTPLVARIGKKKGKQTGATQSWLPLERCKRMHR